jgi:hypothetical protein
VDVKELRIASHPLNRRKFQLYSGDKLLVQGSSWTRIHRMGEILAGVPEELRGKLVKVAFAEVVESEKEEK